MQTNNAPETLVQAGVLQQLRSVTEAAVIACAPWVGRGQKAAGDGAAVDAIRAALAAMPFETNIVVGEGEKDNAPQLYTGEKLGDASNDLLFDGAVDPVECTSYMAHGMFNSFAVMALTERGGMLPVSNASYYMDKISVSAAAKGVLQPEWSVAKKLDALAQVLNKNQEELTIYLLDRPRHKDLLAALYAANVHVVLHSAGDVAGALLAAMPHSGVDMLLGTGGTPESLLSAVAVKALGGAFFARYNPQLETEAAALAQAGISTSEWLTADQLILANDLYFCASGLTDGLLLDGVRQDDQGSIVQSLLISHLDPNPQYVTARCL